VVIDELKPGHKGAIAEAEFYCAAVRLGYAVLRPMAEGGRYDLALDDGVTLVRVQCKWARRRGDVIAIPLRTSRHTPRGYVRTTYTPNEIDAVGVYCPDVDRCYLIPICDITQRAAISLRLAPARNNQAAGVKWAAEYEFGAIAQLGERRHGMAEVGGSSPPGSTPQAADSGGLFAS
jgi:PD-(D/E)XK endonuclease